LSTGPGFEQTVVHFFGDWSPLFPGNSAILVQKLRYRYRLYPHPHQKAALARAFGCARVVWNDALALCQELYQQGEKYPGSTALQKLCITQAKQSAERSWLAEVSNVPWLSPFAISTKPFVRGGGASRASAGGRSVLLDSRQGIGGLDFLGPVDKKSMRFTRNAFWVEEHTLRLTKVGAIPITWSRPLPAPASSCAIIKDCAGRYFASFVVEVERPKLAPNNKAIGIDLGLASLAVTSDGEKIAPPKFLRSALKRIEG